MLTVCFTLIIIIHNQNLFHTIQIYRRFVTSHFHPDPQTQQVLNAKIDKLKLNDFKLNKVTL